MRVCGCVEGVCGGCEEYEGYAEVWRRVEDVVGWGGDACGAVEFVM